MGCRNFELLEQARLRRHFRTVVAELRGSDVSDLTVEQRFARAAVLDEVERYERRGLFPKNRHTPDTLAPTFIDEEGTRCAVAHLLESTGEFALAARIAGTRNTSLVPALACDRNLVTWIEGAGLTIAEAARIQPSYCDGTKAAHCVCYAVDAVTGVVEGTVTQVATTVGTTTRVRVDAVHGDVGSLVVGADLVVSAAHDETMLGDVLIFGVRWADRFYQTSAMHIRADGYVDLPCTTNPRLVSVPELRGEDALAALVASTRGQAACEASLERVDSTWGVGPCEEPGEPGQGCSVSAGSELVVGGALLAATLRGRSRRHPAR